jgi:hypothetical protein
VQRDDYQVHPAQQQQLATLNAFSYLDLLADHLDDITPKEETKQKYAHDTYNNH